MLKKLWSSVHLSIIYLSVCLATYHLSLVCLLSLSTQLPSIDRILLYSFTDLKIAGKPDWPECSVIHPACVSWMLRSRYAPPQPDSGRGGSSSSNLQHKITVLLGETSVYVFCTFLLTFTALTSFLLLFLPFWIVYIILILVLQCITLRQLLIHLSKYSLPISQGFWTYNSFRKCSP